MIGSRTLGCQVIGGVSLILLAIIILFHILSWNSKGVVGHMIVIPGDSRVYTEEFGNTIRGYEDGGVVYFFLPSYINLGGLDYESSQLHIYERNGNLLTNPKMNEILEVEVGEDVTHTVPYKVGFYHSENLYTLDISLYSNESDDIEHDMYMDAFMTAYSPEGVRVYTGEISVKGRGNSTWGNPKNPYEIRLADEVSFCGMNPSDKWCLLANYFDDTKIINKMVYDTAAKIGMEYAIESDWIDLYINGDYVGNYLMCHEPHISSTDLDIGNLEKINRPYFDPAKSFETDSMKGYLYEELPDDISGGYLIEANYLDAYEMKNSGFILDCDKPFTIKSPDNASYEEVEYISGFMNMIDDEIHSGDIDTALHHIDMDSFAKRFIIDEIFNNVDESGTSYFFYKKRGYDKLYAGPCWDYDKSCGIGGRGQDYTESTLDDDSDEDIDWIDRLMEYPEFKKYVSSILRNSQEEFNRVALHKIIDYKERINASVIMDSIRWDTSGVEESYVRLRDYLLHRIEFVKGEYNVKAGK